MRSRRRPTVFLASLATVALLAGCGGGDDRDAGSDGIASLGTPAADESPPTTAAGAEVDDPAGSEDPAGTDDPALADDPVGSTGSTPSDSIVDAADTPSTDPEQAMLDFAECMRNEGIDMPDPEPGGGITMSAGDRAGDNDPDALQQAQETCQPLLEASMANIERDPEREAEMREQMLAFAECMREHGIDMPDPEFDENGGVAIQVGSADGDQGPDEDEFEEASEACGQEGGAIAIGAPAGSLPEGDD
jgi:hypothetical protein